LPLRRATSKRTGGSILCSFRETGEKKKEWKGRRRDDKPLERTNVNSAFQVNREVESKGVALRLKGMNNTDPIDMKKVRS